MILLLFGQPGSGKTTLSNALKSRLSHTGVSRRKVVTIDADRWLKINRHKDFSREGRMCFFKGACDMALYLEREGFFVIMSFVAPHAELRDHIRSRTNSFREIYLFYQGNRGRKHFFQDYEEPPADVIRLDTGRLSPNECIETILECLHEENPTLSSSRSRLPMSSGWTRAVLAQPNASKPSWSAFLKKIRHFMTIIVHRKRHIAKAVTYRFLSTGLGFLAVWMGTGSMKAGILFSVADLVLKPVLYYLHDRVWFKHIPYGLK
jgi:adenylylsulfate kinase-like enzyme/uncharacterized membrane protein